MGSDFSKYADCATIPDRLRRTAELQPDREVMKFYDNAREQKQPFTARELYEIGGRFASMIRNAGFRPGDVIANTLPNSPERLFTDIGIMMAGCAVMHGQILLADGEDFFNSARVARCSAVIVADNNQHCPAWKLMQPYIPDVRNHFITKISCDRAPELTKVILVTREKDRGFEPLMEELQDSAKSGDVFHNTDIGADDLAYIMCTSGSTGFSKLVPRSHEEIFTLHQVVINGVKRLCPLDEQSNYYNDRPMGWGGGLPFGQYCGGDKRVLTDLWYPCDPTKSGEQVWRMIVREKCSVALVLPLETNHILSFLAKTDDEEAKAFRVKVWLTGGQPLMNVQLKEYFKLCEYIIPVYGSTEVLVATMGLLSKKGIDQVPDYSSGKLLPHLEMRIVDKSGRPVSVGEDGEIHLLGLGIAPRYFNRLDPESKNLTQHITSDGWYATGDIGHLDLDGNLYVKGRKNDVIMYGASVVYPGWLEQRILRHPSVATACVVPVPDPVLFHAICACVEVQEGHTLTEEDLKPFCERLFLSEGAMTPKPGYFLIFQTEFPQTASGKPDRQKLKKMAAEKFGKMG